MNELAKKLSGVAPGLKRLSEDLERASTNIEEYAENLMTGPILVGSEFEEMFQKSFFEATQEERDAYMNILKIVKDTEQKIVRLFDV